jgi:hypothetical protein
MGTSPGESPSGWPLIDSDRVEGTTVYDQAGQSVGEIRRLMIEKVSGRVVYAVMTFGGLLGFGADERILPWGKLRYDPGLGGYRIDVTQKRLQDAPSLYDSAGFDWRDRRREQELHDYWEAMPYW